MDLTAVLDRVEQKLKERGLSANAASVAAGKPDAIRNMRRAVKNGDRQGVSTATLAALAPVLGTSLSWLMEGGQEDRSTSEARLAPGHPHPIPIVGKAAAGVFREVIEYDDEEPEMLFGERDPEFPNARMFALEIEGDSMNAADPPIVPGSRVICIDFDDTGLPLEDGMLVAIERTSDGGLRREWSVKEVEYYADRVEFHPRSTNKRHRPIIVPHDTDSESVEVRVFGLVREINTSTRLRGRRRR